MHVATQHSVDEVAACGAGLGPQMKHVGFYSCRGISRHSAPCVCQLRNLTMTITTFREEAG